MSTAVSQRFPSSSHHAGRGWAWPGRTRGCGGVCHGSAGIVTTVFFDSAQTTNLVAAGVTSDTIRSEGYLFTVTRDKLFTGGVGLTNPIGRSIRVPWPLGLEAQAVTTGPAVGGAKLTIRREDSQPFDIPSFSFKLLGNTAGAGAALEIMPKLLGEDGLPDPLAFDASGYYGGSFAYQTSALTGYDSYTLSLYVDFALTRLTVVDATPPPPELFIFALDATTVEVSWPDDAAGYALESTTNLAVQAWHPVTNSILTSGNLFTVQLPTVESHRFLRLRK